MTIITIAKNLRANQIIPIIVVSNTVE